MNKTKIIQEIEEALKQGRLLDIFIKKNLILVKQVLKTIPDSDYWFEYDGKSISFDEEPMVETVNDVNGIQTILFVSDFSLKCKLTTESRQEQKDILIKATVRVFKHPQFDIDKSKDSSEIEIWDQNQKMINLFQIHANQRLLGIESLTYDYGYYTETWSKIDSNCERFKKQEYVTSYFYLQEIVECYERIKHLLAITLLSSDYANNYLSHEKLLPKEYDYLKVFEINDNFTLYDRYYLMYAELTIESLYKFWERVGVYIWQFINSRKNNSNEKIFFDNIINKIKNAPIKNPHSNWFICFHDTDYKKLKEKRNPSVHYKIETDEQSKISGDGSLIPNVLNGWITAKSQDLKKIESENKQLKEFLLKQFGLCKTGYEHMIALIKLLPDKEY